MDASEIAHANSVQTTMIQTPSRVYHFGPSARSAGGMGSVIDTLVSRNMGADLVSAVPTWVPGSHAKSGVLAGRAMALAYTLPRSCVMHIHMSERGSFIREGMVLAAGRSRRLATVVTVHGAEFDASCEQRPGLVRGVLKMASAVTVLTEAALAAVSRLAPHVRVEIIPNPVDLDISAPPVQESPELILFAGEIGTRKGADILADAWRSVISARPRARCLLVGPSTDLLLPPVEGLEVLPPVARDELKLLIRQARAIALPSRHEAMPMSLLEACAAGRPFVSTPVGGIPALSRGGLLVPVGDSEALARALISLLADASFAQALGTAGQQMCDECMSVTRIGERLRVLYTSLV